MQQAQSYAAVDCDVEKPNKTHQRQPRSSVPGPRLSMGAPSPVVWGLVAALVSTLLLMSVSVIPAGHAGVVDFFGTVYKGHLESGFRLRRPLASVSTYSLKTQLLEFHEDVPSTEGLMVGLDLSVQFHVLPEMVVNLYTTVGMDYQSVLVQPEVRSAIRDLTGKTSAKKLYNEGRESITVQVQQQLNSQLNPRGIIIEHVMLRGVKLPLQLQQAIEAKLQSEQESQRMEFVLTKEKQEAERKRIEAQGIADFQDIVSKGISGPLLEWKGIEATERLAASHNAKIVMFGNPANGLPTILGGMGSMTGENAVQGEKQGTGGAQHKP
eukprot:CAMPEP_0119108130 /NCGR_PEP_ID=MMETSP1180-20130426/13483_1 /TAXON_ID=3052 ORGANISM="Chlamydomonas cf sp, Strain CCMP681" /NCGR_SAMPLE_ID=MMETSP1180 /ASSEMBLY_ACC=CAM_ASM_000741 /LENGTH=323 /DNA_ID=CAMNT_0007093713 /DNA_START=15 /DNA_END=986 /DNA_ORIENTATION=-